MTRRADSKRARDSTTPCRSSLQAPEDLAGRRGAPIESLPEVDETELDREYRPPHGLPGSRQAAARARSTRWRSNSVGSSPSCTWNRAGWTRCSGRSRAERRHERCLAVMKRELRSYFATPIAYVFIVIFLALSSAFTFYLGNFYERGQADLASFFTFHPWLFLFLVPALSMRLWAEERKSGSIELLMTLPIEVWQAVIGKFLAAWLFTGLAIALTFPIWITVNYLGRAGQRGDPGRVRRQLLDGRRISRGGRVHLGDHEEPSHRVHLVGRRVLLAAAGGLRPRAERVFGLGAASRGRRGRELELPHALREHQQGRHRLARPRSISPC